MPISSKRRRHITHAMDHICDNCLGFARSSVLAPLPSGTDLGNHLYDTLFGREPITTTTTLSPQLQALPTDIQKRILPEPITPSTNINLTLPLSLRSSLDLPASRRSLGFLTDACSPYWKGDRNPNLNFANYNLFPEDPIFEPFYERCRNALLERLGQEHFDSIMRLVTLNDLLSAIPANLCAYIIKCRSLGGLFLRLPVLHSLLPDWSKSATHVRLTRETPLPPPSLVADLGVLASLDSARRSSQKK